MVNQDSSQLSANEIIQSQSSIPFEGPEKLLEVWFAPSEQVIAHTHLTNGSSVDPNSQPGDAHSSSSKAGLRTVPFDTWVTMLQAVNCQIISVKSSHNFDAYLLSESSMFVWPHKIILKTCGTTTLLLGLKPLLEIAKERCGFTQAWRVFYSRKSFIFPANQLSPHRSWEEEVDGLDKIFDGGSAHVMGEQGKNQWHLYLTRPQFLHGSLGPSFSTKDTTLEILMTGLSPEASKRFCTSENIVGHPQALELGRKLAESLGIDSQSLITNGHETDAYMFSPCGYSANMIGGSDQNQYATIHVTPEEGHSFASFECNDDYTNPGRLKKVISKILNVFQPKDVTMTLFVSHAEENLKNKVFDKIMKDGIDLNGYQLCQHSTHPLDGYDLLFTTFQRDELS